MFFQMQDVGKFLWLWIRISSQCSFTEGNIQICKANITINIRVPIILHGKINFLFWSVSLFITSKKVSNEK